MSAARYWGTLFIHMSIYSSSKFLTKSTNISVILFPFFAAYILSLACSDALKLKLTRFVLSLSEKLDSVDGLLLPALGRPALSLEDIFKLIYSKTQLSNCLISSVMAMISHALSPPDSLSKTVKPAAAVTG